MEMPRIMLLQIFAAWPAAASPQWTTRLPIRDRIGSARSNGFFRAARHEGERRPLGRRRRRRTRERRGS
jgi:hypothetical protein